MVGQASVGRDCDRDRDCDRSGNILQHPAFPPPEPPLSNSRPFNLPTPSSASQARLPLLPESLVSSRPNITAHIATVIRSNTVPDGLADTPTLPTASASLPTIRAVTPDTLDPRSEADGVAPSLSSPPLPPTGRASQSSPRTSPADSAFSRHGSTSSRRQGVVFSDEVAGPLDSAAASSPPSRSGSFRPRTYTMDSSSSLREPSGSTATPEPRNRVGSFSSTATADSSQRLASVLQGVPLDIITPTRSLEAQASTAGGSKPAPSSAGAGLASPVTSTSASSFKDKRNSSRRLIKKTAARPTSPLISAPPSADSLLLPIPTTNANNVVLLMKTLCGKMRGEIEYRGGSENLWSQGLAYIDESKGSLMFDAVETTPFSTPIVPDLRGCRVWPAEQPDKDNECLELTNAQASIEIVIRPLADGELDLWLAALLCWQQVRPVPGSATAPNAKAANSRNASAAVAASTSAPVPDPSKRRTSVAKAREGTIIKVGKVMLWDKGTTTSPRTEAAQASWRRVSCILYGNGEFKFMTENGATILSIIDLTQLARFAIQQLHKSVLDEEYSIAIFPIYSSTSTHMSIFRPTFIALDSRVSFEVWYVLLGAFAVPNIFVLDFASDQVTELADGNGSASPSSPSNADKAEQQQQKQQQQQQPEEQPQGQRCLFRLEKTLNLRITEAKLKPRVVAGGTQEQPTPRHHDRFLHDKSGKNDHPDPLMGNYLAEVMLDGEVRARTTTKMDTKNPFWREDCEFFHLPPTMPYLSIILKSVDGFDTYTHQLQASLGLPRSSNLREEERGSVDIPLSSLEAGKDHEQWFPILDEEEQTIGSMLVKVQHEELAVLTASDYTELSDMLHRLSSGLTLQIAEVMPGNLRRLSRVFINIFQVTGFAADWLMALVEDEIDGIGSQVSIKKERFSRRLRSNESLESTSDREQQVRDMGKSLQGEANLLFRGNTLLTQALEFHMRRLGKEYLEEVLSDKIFEINEINPDCEVDPSKIQHGEDLNKHWDQLMMYTNEVWECIAFSAARFPPELRHILKYIRAVADDRYGNFLRTVAYTSVSGFLFLRFICPAILNPKLFGLLRDHPRPRAQRTFTLIAKGLQALANLSTIGKKETWMEPMNKFLTGQRNTVKDLIDAICSISAEKNNIVAPLPASYSTPFTIIGRLSPTSREGCPSLPYLIDYPRNLAALVKIWTDAHPPSMPPKRVLEGDLLDFHNICAELQAKSDGCFSGADTLVNASGPDDNLAERLGKISLSDNASITYGSQTEAGSNGGSTSSGFFLLPNRPPGSSGSEMDDQWVREPKGLLSFGILSNDGPPDAGGSSKTLRNGKHARRFFSGIISRKPRTSSPERVDEADIAGRDRDDREVRERKRDRVSEGEPDKEKDKDREGFRERLRDRIERDKDRDREREKEKEKEREKEKEKEREREKEREKERIKKEKERAREERNRERERERERHKRTGSKDKSSRRDKPFRSSSKTDKSEDGSVPEPWSPTGSATDSVQRHS